MSTERITVTATVTLPRPPNFLRYGDEQSIDVADITDESLQQIGEAWTKALLEHAEKRRSQREVPR